MRQSPIKRIAAGAVLTAVALTIFVLEAAIPAPIPVPGIKLGLANIVTIFTLLTYGPVTALSVLLCRIILGALVTGQPSAILYSLSGGFVSFLFAAVLYGKFPKNQIWVLSSLSAIIHNLCQVTVAVLITQTMGLYVYVPALTVSGIITGAFTGLAAQLLLFRLTGSGVVSFYNKTLK